MANDLAQQALSQAGFEVYVTKPHSEIEGATANFEAGSVLIRWTPPSNPSQNVFVIALGGARAGATASPGFETTTPPPVVPGDGGSSAPSGGGVVTPSGSTGGAATVTPAASTAPPAAGGSSTPVATEPIAALFGGISLGWVILALSGAGLFAAGTKRLADDIVDRRPSTCPLETT